MNLSTSPNSSEIVINWHITEACNYSCKYCYAHWEPKPRERELIHNPGKVLRLINEIDNFFRIRDSYAKSGNSEQHESIRLNIAGGEPTLYQTQLKNALSQAQSVGMQLSIISNGSKLDAQYLSQIVPMLTMLGLSIDSSNDQRNIQIGRMDRNGDFFSANKLTNIINQSRELNPELILKVNTVVNAINLEEDFSPVIEKISPSKWKVFQMLPQVTRSLEITNSEFQAFIDRHQQFKKILRAESNQAMSESYIMIDPIGRFFQNFKGQGYQYSDPILDVGIAKAFSQIQFSMSKFKSRYLLNEDSGK